MVTSPTKTATTNNNNEYLVRLLKQEIKNEEAIISNASNACHNIKTFIVCFLLPFLGAVLAGYFGAFTLGCQYAMKTIYVGVCIFILFIVLTVQILTHQKFYALQSSHRKLLGSLNLMLGTAIRNYVNLPSPFSYETLKDYLKITEAIDKKSNVKNAKVGFFKDTLIYLIPMMLMLTLCVAALIIVVYMGLTRGW